MNERLAENSRTAITVALIGAGATIAAAAIGVALTRGGDGGDSGRGVTFPTIDGVGAGNASVFLNRTSGAGGSEVRVSGEGFEPGERVVIMFHTDEVGSTTASDQGRFANVAVTIPTSFSQFAPQQFSIIARGERSLRTARTPFTISG